ncbi:hypothetical protein EYF80_045292 [Liparis tanakae]|uniref:Uncharacterized protein n=1 Tax=Liparis tanakae TaxID=230148 RepID=A0A4Z2FTG7_9TELE|nr:hypothetical protein EYF80_045292 [Liparis tanakae]
MKKMSPVVSVPACTTNALAVVIAERQISAWTNKRFSHPLRRKRPSVRRASHLSIISCGPWSMPMPSRSSITASR